MVLPVMSLTNQLSALHISATWATVQFLSQNANLDHLCRHFEFRGQKVCDVLDQLSTSCSSIDAPFFRFL
jgi:hypothetical protein